ncbi:MAG: cysteine--tRNA ligase [archaeon]|nr:cysteine--tRNA ligase [archaeon]
MPLKFYNTFSAKKETFKPLSKKETTMYVCGITPYNYSHIGHLRTAVSFDLVRRILKKNKFKTRFATNYTDVDDKLIKRANEEGKDFKQIANEVIADYQEMLAKLNVQKADAYPRVTSSMNEIIATIESIVQNGFAYEVEGNVFFNVKKFKEYGKLSKQSIDKIIKGGRIEIDKDKKNPEDFALWKKAKQGEPLWESPWGKGRPGWHIECSAMISEFLGKTIDIHGGGNDLIFPHHENEIAQSFASNKKPLAKFWLHGGMLNLEKEKMSKSLGNVFNARELLGHFSPELVRFYLISAHYRKPLNFSTQAIEEKKPSYEFLENFWNSINEKQKKSVSGAINAKEKVLLKKIASFEKKFFEALNDDVNSPQAISEMFSLAREINKDSDFLKHKKLFEKIVETFEEFFEVLGLKFTLMSERKKAVDSKEIEALIKQRNDARKRKDFAKADEIRNELKARGILLNDSGNETTWSLIE